MPEHPSHRLPESLTRRSALAGVVGLLAFFKSRLGIAAAPPPESAVWPRAAPVPGGIARLSLGPAASRPVAQAGQVPLLVVGDVIDWTALVGIALSATPGNAAITVQAVDGSAQRLVSYTVAPLRYRMTVRGTGLPTLHQRG